MVAWQDLPLLESLSLCLSIYLSGEIIGHRRSTRPELTGGRFGETWPVTQSQRISPCRQL